MFVCSAAWRARRAVHACVCHAGLLADAGGPFNRQARGEIALHRLARKLGQPRCRSGPLQTLAGLVGAKGDTATDGLSLLPLLRNPRAHLQRDALYFHYPRYYATTSPVSAVREGDWKLLEYFEDNHIELYNLRDDFATRLRNNLDEPPDCASGCARGARKWAHSCRRRVDHRFRGLPRGCSA